MNSNAPHIDHLITNGYEFRLGDYLNRGWELFMQDIGPYIGYAVVAIMSSVILGFIPVLGTIANLFVQPALLAGFYLYTNKVAVGENRIFKDFFGGFDHIMQLFLNSLVVGILVVIGMIFLIIPGIYLAVSYSLSVQLILFEGMEFWPAMETSRKIVGKNWGNFFLLGLVAMLIMMAGFILLGVGIFAAAPLIYCIFYAVYEDLIGFQQDGLMDKIEEIGMEEEEDLFEGLS